MKEENGNVEEHDADLSMEELGEQVFDELENPEPETVEDTPEQEAEPETTEEVKEEEPEQPLQVEFADAPDHWNKELKESFNNILKTEGLPQETAVMIRDGMEQTYKGLISDYQKSKQALKETEQFQHTLAEKLAPFQQQIAEYGNNLPELITKFLSIDNDLKRDFDGTIKALAPLYGHNTNNDDVFIDPMIQKQEQTISQLQQQIQQLTGQFQNTQRNQQETVLNGKIQEFQTATNQDGTLKHPHFNDEQVQNYMKMYGDNAARTGQVMTPEEAYNLACKTLGKDAPIAAQTVATPPKRIKQTTKVVNKPNQTIEQQASDAYDELFG